MNSGTVSTEGGSAAGIAGHANGTITRCVNKAAISSGLRNVAGIVGYTNYTNDTGTDCNISYCYNFGTITVTNTVESTSNRDSGGIVGDYRRGTISYCWNAGNVYY